MRPALWLRILALAALALLALGSTHASAQTFKEKKEARAIAKEAQRAEKTKDFAAAKEAYERAIDLHASSKYLLGLARAEAGLGNLLGAIVVLESVESEPKAANAHKRRAKQAIKRLEKRLAKVSITVPEGFAGVVSLDGETLSRDALKEPTRLNPGSHTVTAEAEGFEPFEEKLDLGDGESKTVAIAMVAAAGEGDDPPVAAAPAATAATRNDEDDGPADSGGGSASTTLGIIGLAVGAVGIGVGVGFGLASKSTRDDLSDVCPNDLCPEDQRDNFDTGKQQATISTIGFIAGGVGLAAGTAFLLFGSSGDGDSAKPAVEPTIGWASIGARGRF